MDNACAPYIPESAPFTAEQRAWLNGFLAGLFSQAPVGPPASTATNGAPGQPLLVMFGSQTGTAEALAKRVAKEGERHGFRPEVLTLNEYEKANLTKAKKLIVISSTWGDGEPPDNAANFWRWINSDNAPRLEHLEFAVLGLGDRNYADFCGASKKFDARLANLGAKRMAPLGECDVEYEAPAAAWIGNLWPKLEINGHPSSPLAKNGALTHSNGAVPQSAPGYSKTNPFPAPVLKNLLLNKPGSAKEVRHYELSLAKSGLTYEVGDALGICVTNCPDLVSEILSALSLRGNESVDAGGIAAPLREALTFHFDITRPSRELLAVVAQAVPDCEFAGLLEVDRSADLKSWLWGRDVLDILRLLPGTFGAPELVQCLRKLAPRLYSISSSSKAHPGEVHLTVSTVRYETFGRGRKGVASSFLADRAGNGLVKSFVQKSPQFKLPSRSDAPVIMVGPGTGIAPFRAFLEEREVAGAKGKNWLFFGEQKRATDFFYEDQLTTWRRNGHLARLDLAFSRDQERKIYVQHRLSESASEVWGWLEEGAYFYVCGDGSKMAADVDRALHEVIEQAGDKTTEQAAAYVANLRTEKRYQRDVY